MLGSVTTLSIMETGSPKLEAYLSDLLEAKYVKIVSVNNLSYGAIQQNWAVEIQVSTTQETDRRELILRMDAPTSIDTSHSRRQEFDLLTCAFHQGCLVPQPLAYCADPVMTGKPFFVMPRLPGTADARLLTKIPFAAEQQKVIVQSLGRELAKIHNIDPSPEISEFLPKPKVPPVDHMIATYRAYLDQLPKASPVIELGLRWAECNQPVEQEYTICHRDFRTGNILIDNGKITGILDWEFAGWSDPMEDIGWFCAKCWRFSNPQLEAGGLGNRLDFIAAYEAHTERKVRHASVLFWEIIAHIRWAIIAKQQGERFATDREQSLEAALTSYIAPELELEILKIIEPSEAIC